MPTETVDFYDLHDIRGRKPGGVYLDVEERKAAEIKRAEIEGREPDLDNPGSTAGTSIFTEAAARNVLGLPQNVSIDVEPVQSLPVDVTDGVEQVEGVGYTDVGEETPAQEVANEDQPEGLVSASGTTLEGHESANWNDNTSE